MSYENLQYDSGMQLKTHRQNYVLFTTQCFFFFFSPMAFVRRVIKRLTYLLTYITVASSSLAKNILLLQGLRHFSTNFPLNLIFKISTQDVDIAAELPDMRINQCGLSKK